jgi:hypothetical protein
VIDVFLDPDWVEPLPLAEDARRLAAIVAASRGAYPLDGEANMELAIALSLAPGCPPTGVVVVDPEAFASAPPRGGVPIAITPPEHLYRYSCAAELRALLEGAWNEWFATLAAYPQEQETLPSLDAPLELAAARELAARSPYSVACGNDSVVVVPRAWPRERVVQIVQETVARAAS